MPLSQTPPSQDPKHQALGLPVVLNKANVVVLIKANSGELKSKIEILRVWQEMAGAKPELDKIVLQAAVLSRQRPSPAGR